MTAQSDQKKKSASIPQWDNLCLINTDNSFDISEKQQVDQLKEAKPSLFFRTVTFCIKLVSREYTVNKFASFTWAEIVDIIHDQTIRNKKIKQQSPSQKSHSSHTLIAEQCNRYNQLPCTSQTTSNRVSEAKKICKLDDPILVIGDDDMVGIELCKAGFTDVTSIDIDPKICSILKQEAKKQGLTLKVYEHDINNPPPDKLQRKYGLIFLDPMYSIDGVKLFAKAALQMNQNNSNCKFFLSIHLMSLLKEGQPKLVELLNRLGFRVAAFKPSFNVYPVPGILKFFITLFNIVFMRTKIMAEQNYRFSFFLSDAILLEKK